MSSESNTKGYNERRWTASICICWMCVHDWRGEVLTINPDQLRCELCGKDMDKNGRVVPVLDFLQWYALEKVKEIGER